MVLITGGAFQGKLDFAVEKTGLSRDSFLDGRTCSPEDIRKTAGIFHFQDYVKMVMSRDKDGGNGDDFPDKMASELISLCPELVIVTDEIGCGIVPMDRDDRRWRETVGRVCTKLAAFSSEVYRVSCGIGVCIKG